ncbi:MAG: AAA family ATPase [Deltaproteobacteria bacterium]|nr:AAA family ATPase [Deltaproteobacteria bacterium]
MKKIKENITIKTVEQALLSSILIDNRNLQEANSIGFNDFYDSRHRVIFAKMQELYNAGKPIDPITLEMPDEYDYLLDLLDMPAGLLNVEEYVRQILENSNKRSLISKIENISLRQDNANYNDLKLDVIEFANNLKEKDTTTKFNFLKPQEIKSEKASFLLEDFMPLPIGAETIISSKGGSGKSALALQLALRASATGIKTLAWLSEDPITLTKHRLEKISKMTEININDNLMLCGDTPFNILVKNNKNIKVNPVFYDFMAACKNFKIVIIDPLIAFYGADENSNYEARYFMELFSKWAKEENKAIIIIHHQTKYIDVSIARGAGAFIDAVRAHYSAEKDKDDNRYVNVRIEKDNWGIGSIFKKEKQIQLWAEKLQGKEEYYKENKEKNINIYEKYGF